MKLNDAGLPLDSDERVLVRCSECGVEFEIYRWQFEEDIAHDGNDAEWPCTSCYKEAHPDIAHMFWNGEWAV